MTGFGAADGRVGNLRVSVELRTVNHRFFSPSIKLPSALARWEHDVRERLRTRIARGHVTLFARVDREGAEVDGRGVMIDEARLASYIDAHERLVASRTQNATLDFATLLRLPGVLIERETEEPVVGSIDELLVIVDAASDAHAAMRVAEGTRLAEVLEERLRVMEAAYDRIADRAPRRLVEQRDRLRVSVRELADGVDVDDQRLAQEIAVLVDRLDVSEEIDRFRAHLAAFREALMATGDEPVGKRLGFVLQEMLREANTTGSKANDATLLRDVVILKEELERVREQVENVE